LKRFGKRPVELMEDLGWAGEDVWYAHAIHLSDSEIESVAAARTGVAHCPSSNMRLGAGICRVADLVRAGARVGLGVDGSASNEDANLAVEAHQALLLARARSASPQALAAADEPSAAGIFPAYQRSYRAAPDPLALVRAELVAVEEILAANEVMMAEVGDPEIGIEARCDVALARQPESLRDVGRRDGGDARLVQPALGQQQLARRLAARHATPHMKEVLPALQLEGAGRVVGNDHRQSSLGQHVPEAIAIVRGPEGRRAFAHAAKALEVLLHIQEVVGTGLGADVDASLLGLADELRPHDGADVDDVQRAAGFGSELDRAKDRSELGFGR